MNLPFQALACPLDGLPLQPAGAMWRCASGHSFDVAREGYIHLLPVQNKRSRDPGDSKEMVAARRRFLNAGHYQPIAQAVSRSVLAAGAGRAAVSVLDAGCGEGYYLRQLTSALAPSLQLVLIGLDISKWAVQAAAKQQRDATWLVGSNANLPVMDATLDCVLCMFGFPVYAEVQVDAGPEHLRELREIIYPTLKSGRADDAQTPPGFHALACETLRFELKLGSAEQIGDLLLMTPHLFRATAQGRARAAALRTLALTVDVRLACLMRDSS